LLGFFYLRKFLAAFFAAKNLPPSGSAAEIQTNYWMAYHRHGFIL